ncbi:hypothetical protein PIB30_097694 [Stylosanthes scabra]|uniref:Putative plant transposon protein domain-containing protein n=1 Tax=Stylosanthes scabra TaxID=79078 RepID=A0ABU6TW13_9FABA|nr:hypothetical protein [Stylosanthes scabra]
MDQRLDEVLTDLCIQGATWKLSSGQPTVPIQLRWTELHPLAKGWQEFIIHSLVPTGNKSEVTTARAILIHCIMRGEDIYNHNQRFHSQVWQEQEKLAKEIQEVRRSQLTQTLANNKRLETEKNMQLALERLGRDIVEMRKQLNLRTRNTSAREAYTCWAHQQANPNLSEIPITQIPDIMQTNAEKGRPMFYGCLKSDYGATSSSQVDPQELVPLRTTPPSPGFHPPHPPPN